MDPYRDRKVYHLAKLFGKNGVSALCYKQPRAICLRLALWTITPRQVTCRKCRKLMERL